MAAGPPRSGWPRLARRATLVPIVVAAILLAPATAARSDWEFNYLPRKEPGASAFCTAGIFYSDGFFIMRLHGDSVDFMFLRHDFAIPANRHLGRVAFAFAEEDYALEAYSVVPDPDSSDGRVPNVVFLAADGDLEAIVDRLRRSSAFDVVFPDRSSYTIGLAGSDRAIRRAVKCWAEKETGEGKRNPFEGVSGHNPFERRS